MEMEIIMGIALAAVLVLFIYGCNKTGCHVCPGCGERICFSRADRNRMRFGRLPCPKCGTLIEADH